MDRFDGGDLLAIVAAICITTIICVVTVNISNNTKEMIRNGYTQTQKMGEGVIWSK